MDFSKLLAKASSNAASAKSRVEEATREMDAQKLRREAALRGQQAKTVGQPRVGDLLKKRLPITRVAGMHNNKPPRAGPEASKPTVAAVSKASTRPSSDSKRAKPAPPTADTYTITARQNFYHLMQKAENNVSKSGKSPSKTGRLNGARSIPERGPPVNGLRQQQALTTVTRRRETPPPLGVSANIDLTSAASRRKRKAEPVRPAPRQQPPQRAQQGTGNKGCSLSNNQAMHDGGGQNGGVSFAPAFNERRYLPGDLRYRPPTDTNMGRQAPAPHNRPQPRLSHQVLTPPPAKSLKREPLEREPHGEKRRLNEASSAHRLQAGNNRGNAGSRLATTAGDTERRQLEKELEELDRLKAERIAKLKRMREAADLRRQPPPQQRRQPPASSSRSVAYPYPAKSRHAEEKEYDDDGEEEDSEYDSDMANFIDDTDLDVDEVGRSEMEAALKLLNPKYDTKKWKERERQIDLNRMHSSHRDIEKEEALSRRLGLYEDLREAKRGSQRIKE